ncbi:MAG: flavin reductase (DIM6/NTAB) family NADH-FMN oxidoreductase RutF [Porticoccaceae bacterium]|jgi:flavin reductase (DIM6/NTAB) family NADH-FMN oxidoreductase RutF
MAFFTNKDISELEHIYKINLVNSLSGYKSANLIGSISNNGIENVAVFSSVIHLGSNPPLLGFILRPTTVPRGTYKNIKETGVYTINHIAKNFIEDAHHTSAKYASEISEFDITELNSYYLKEFKAPFVAQSPIKIAIKYVEEYYIKANNVIMVVGEVQSVTIEDDLLQKDGFVDLSKGNIAAINGLDGYAIPTLETRQPYQRPKKINIHK